MTTRSFVQSDGRNDASAAQWKATWRCRWKRGGENQLLLRGLQVADYEQVTALQSGEPWFSDCTVAATRILPFTIN